MNFISDSVFLHWLYERLVNTHNEDPSQVFMQKLKKLAYEAEDREDEYNNTVQSENIIRKGDEECPF